MNIPLQMGYTQVKKAVEIYSNILGESTILSNMEQLVSIDYNDSTNIYLVMANLSWGQHLIEYHEEKKTFLHILRQTIQNIKL